MSEWQPIETAPLREAVLVHHSAHWTRLACRLENGVWRQWPGPTESEPLAYIPTHWAAIPDPLPEPPILSAKPLTSDERDLIREAIGFCRGQIGRCDPVRMDRAAALIARLANVQPNG